MCVLYQASRWVYVCSVSSIKWVYVCSVLLRVCVRVDIKYYQQSPLVILCDMVLFSATRVSHNRGTEVAVVNTLTNPETISAITIMGGNKQKTNAAV